MSHRGSDLPKVTWQGCVGAESRPPLTLVPVIMLAATTRGYVIPKAGTSAEMARSMLLPDFPWWKDESISVLSLQQLSVPLGLLPEHT